MSSTNQSPEKFRRYRARLKARGLRQIQLWVPDTTKPDFPALIEKQLRQVEESPDDRETLDFIDKVADWDGHGV
jgi:hypothetical protein